MQYLIKSCLEEIINGIYRGGLEFILSVPRLGGFVTIISTLLTLIQILAHSSSKHEPTSAIMNLISFWSLTVTNYKS
jgi:hypothetical protein